MITHSLADDDYTINGFFVPDTLRDIGNQIEQPVVVEDALDRYKALPTGGKLRLDKIAKAQKILSRITPKVMKS